MHLEGLDRNGHADLHLQNLWTSSLGLLQLFVIQARQLREIQVGTASTGGSTSRLVQRVEVGGSRGVTKPCRGSGLHSPLNPVAWPLKAWTPRRPPLCFGQQCFWCQPWIPPNHVRVTNCYRKNKVWTHWEQAKNWIHFAYCFTDRLPAILYSTTLFPVFSEGRSTSLYTLQAFDFKIPSLRCFYRSLIFIHCFDIFRGVCF